jgi:hypothetical protein
LQTAAGPYIWVKSGRSTTTTRTSAFMDKAAVIYRPDGRPLVAEAVEKLRSGRRRRNKRIGWPCGANHNCAVRPVCESILRLRPLKIVFQQPQTRGDIGSKFGKAPQISISRRSCTDGLIQLSELRLRVP